eukprot:3442689-Ditylum_brightwellii.AAC.1
MGISDGITDVKTMGLVNKRNSEDTMALVNDIRYFNCHGNSDKSLFESFFLKAVGYWTVRMEK